MSRPHQLCLTGLCLQDHIVAHEPCDHGMMLGSNTDGGVQKKKKVQLDRSCIRPRPRNRGKRHHRWAFRRVFPQSSFCFLIWFQGWISFFFFLPLFYFYFWKGAEVGVSERHGGLLDRKQTFLVHVTTDADLPFPSLPVSMPSPDVTGAPTSRMLLEPSLTQNSPSSSFQIRRAWSGCCCPGNGWGGDMVQGFPNT